MRRIMSEAGLIRSVIVLGGGTAAWMTAAYLKKAFPALEATVLDACNVPELDVDEASTANLQRSFFDFLGLAEQEWMRECNAAFKVAVKFVNWRKPRSETPDDYYYHLCGRIPNCDNLPLSHYWVLNRLNGDRQRMEYACYTEPKLLDVKLAPRYRDGSRAMSYAWHFDARLLTDYLRRKATSWGVQQIEDGLASVELAPDGSIRRLHTRHGRALTADLFVDCSGPRGRLINEALGEPFIDMSDHLPCDSAIASVVRNDDATDGVDPYTSAIGLDAGWAWKIPMLGRFGAGYVYSSKFTSDAQAARDFCDLWQLDPDRQPMTRLALRVGRNRRSWVKNCVSIGSASCFVEPLEASGMHFICAAISRLARHFPDRALDPVLRARFNAEMAASFDDTRDFLQLHYLTSPREDTAFWRANKRGLKLSDEMRNKLELYRSGLAINMPALDEDEDPGASARADAPSFWTNSSYYCVLAGMDWVPEQPLPCLRYRPESQKKAGLMFEQIRQRSDQLYAQLPTHYEFLHQLHGN
jgi:tryptophan 6-halogenase